MGFGTFILLSLFYAVIGVRVIGQLLRSWRPTFDHRFTMQDRALVDQSAFFILLPLSVALHELGHAVAVWSFGGQVLDFGYYLFAGFVSYDPRFFTDTQRILVALAGPLVSVILGLAAIAVVFLRQPPMRAAFNELLLQFAALSIINALVFYPLLDVFSGLGGDWTQMYRGGVPALSVLIFAGHAGLLGFGIWAFRNDAIQARLAALTGLPRGTHRGYMGGIRQRERSFPSSSSEEERRLRDAAQRVASGWPHPVQIMTQQQRQSQPGGSGVAMTWTGNGSGRSRRMLVRENGMGGLEIWGASSSDAETQPERLLTLSTVPGTDDLTLTLRLAMEDIERRVRE
jgi:hypothetical protein